ncbi:MAG TPA: alpha-amylase family glycosyl hydrolase [Acidobacteriaceae bacterium]|jgi:glycosidase
MEFHISREIREKLNTDDLLFSYTGNVVFANVAASRKLAAQLNTIRGTGNDPDSTVNAGALFAMGLIDELNHALIARYRKEIDPAVLKDALNWLQTQSGEIGAQRLLLTFADRFPNVEVFRGQKSPAQWLAASSEDLPNREAAVEELLLLWLSNQNPAFKPFRELFDDTPLAQATAYKKVTTALPEYFSTRPPVSPEVGSLLDALRAPMLASPESLTGQLDFIREHWVQQLGPDIKRVLLAIDTLREEDIAIWMRFHPPGPDFHRHGAPGRGFEDFRGDEYMGFEEEWMEGPGGVRQRRYATDYQAPLNEYEAFSADQAWMPNVVMVAKSTYVWLEQLSKKYGRHIHRLDQVPDEELRLLFDRGITALWLIGLWERSIASKTIKHLRGNSDAVASAYSLKSYHIAEDLGGDAAYEYLREHAARAGLRLASDMVPNHMGIDSDWVIDHPDWFLYRWESPYPVYSFNGPDLSTDSRVEIKIEDHYYDQSDAAVVFRLRHHRDGATRYMYHGNDGTTFAWNDTAQLDYSKAQVREHVMQVILEVARKFPIIRFDAAMVLAKRHVQRLWFPLPGAGGSIPSRAESAMSQEEFDALMPHEFWREVVDRVAVEVPGTLLLAEAFWLLESYFVRTLGMHRVYNSAFMNMLRDEENAKYRSYLKKTIEFDPDILKRYVNFMSNPDERTAIDQFGSGDKCFGVATLLATLPGLPMFGHGQVEGYTERYGMEFKRARMDESQNDGLIARHMHDIAPLLRKRYIFAESANFVLYDFWHEFGGVDENVFAYSNRHGHERSIILYNNRYEGTRGSIHVSAASMDKGSGELRQRSLTEGLGLSTEPGMIVAYRDRTAGLEYLRRATDFGQYGLTVSLRGYQTVVLLDWRQLRSTEEQPWDRLCDALNGAGVYSVDEALTRLRMRPLHEALRHTLSAENLQLVADIAEELAEKTRETPEAASEPAEEAPETEARPSVLVTPPVLLKPSVLDERLQPWMEKGEAFLALAAEYLPAEDAAPAKEAPEEGADAEPVEETVEKEPVSKSALEQGTSAAMALVGYERKFSANWPSAVSHLIPCTETSVPEAQVWAPVLTYVLLHAVPGKADLAAAFEKLQLRPALAEIFSSFGLEGENAWRAAARVRVLLLAGMSEDDSLLDEGFWADPDVRWLAGVNESHGVTYVNKEGFEELVTVLQIPTLLAIERTVAGAPTLTGIEADMVARIKAMAAAGYKLDEFLAAKPAVTEPDATPAEADSELEIDPDPGEAGSSLEPDAS